MKGNADAGALGGRPRFGFVPPPLDDEPLDAYLQYVTYRLGLQPGAVWASFGLPDLAARSVRSGLSEAAAQQVADATGWSTESVHAMTMRRYAHAGLVPEPGLKGGGPGAWIRRSGSRFCPACLREREGRWRLSWHLQWTFICIEHETLLDVACPACRRPPRTRRGGHPFISSPTLPARCAEELQSGCDCSLNTLAAADLQRDEADTILDRRVPAVFLEAQRSINSRIAANTVVRHLEHDRPSIEWLHDLAALTRLIAVNAPHERIPSVYAEVLGCDNCEAPATADGQTLQQVLRVWQQHWGLGPYTAPAARFTQAGASRVAFPVFATLGYAVLESGSLERAAGVLERILPAESRRAAALSSPRRGISWPLAQALWLAEHRVPESRLRTIRMGGDRFRLDGSERGPLDPARLPARPWAAVRGTLPWSARDPFTGLMFSALLLAAASSRPLSLTCELMGQKAHSARVSYEARRRLAAEAGDGRDDVFDELLAVHDAVSTGNVPIDYQRRRHVFRQPMPLAQRTAKRAARELGLRPTPRLARFMSWWIYEQLSGNDLLLDVATLELPGAIRSIYSRQRKEWDQRPPAMLLRQAEHALLVNCIDEPVTWSPTFDPGRGWTCPPAVDTRQLDWSNRPRRAQARPARTATRGLTLNDIVALARSGQSRETDRLARMLIRFKAVVEAETIAAAAADLAISQATLSRVIVNLEAELDLVLFTRTHQANVLTDQGRRLHRLLRIRPITHVSPIAVSEIKREEEANAASYERGGD